MGTTPTFASSKPSLPTKTLSKHIKRRDWPACRNRLRDYPWDAHYIRDKEKTTPLHLVCMYRAPLEVVQLLVDANPGAIFSSNAAGWTPIHLVVVHGAPPEVALLLIERGGEEACALQSPFSGSALHLACLHGSPATVLQALVTANPTMVRAGRDDDHAMRTPSPAEALWQQFCKNPANRKLVMIMIGSIGNGDGEIRRMDSLQTANVKDLLVRFDILIGGVVSTIDEARNTEMEDDGHPRNSRPQNGGVLYHLVSHQSVLGNLKDCFEVAVNIFPQEELRYMDPSTGNYLLHATCAQPPIRESRCIPTWRRWYIGTRSGAHADGNCRDLIDVLVAAWSHPVGVKNRDGDHPLHLALTKGQRTWRTGVASLVKTRSQLAEIRERESGLYPFQVAAVQTNGKSEVESLETVFHLLLACPHVLLQQL